MIRIRRSVLNDFHSFRGYILHRLLSLSSRKLRTSDSSSAMSTLAYIWLWARKVLTRGFSSPCTQWGLYSCLSVWRRVSASKCAPRLRLQRYSWSASVTSIRLAVKPEYTINIDGEMTLELGKVIIWPLGPKTDRDMWYLLSWV